MHRLQERVRLKVMFTATIKVWVKHIPALSSWWMTIAPSHWPPTATSASNEGSNAYSHNGLTANFGLSGVPICLEMFELVMSNYVVIYN